MGYHRNEIRKGVLGQASKIQEELDEYVDAEEQGAQILMHCELADLYGALESCAESHGLTMKDLRIMSDMTKSAFAEGKR